MENKVINLKERISKDKRKVKRMVFGDLIGASVVVPHRGLVKITLHDISEGGLAFDMGSSHGQFQKGEDIYIRFYMGQDSYFPFLAEVSHVRFVEEEGVFRHGVSFIKDKESAKPLHYLVKFMESVGGSLRSDSGDLMVSSFK